MIQELPPSSLKSLALLNRTSNSQHNPIKNVCNFFTTIIFFNIAKKTMKNLKLVLAAIVMLFSAVNVTAQKKTGGSVTTRAYGNA